MKEKFNIDENFELTGNLFPKGIPPKKITAMYGYSGTNKRGLIFEDGTTHEYTISNYMVLNIKSLDYNKKTGNFSITDLDLQNIHNQLSVKTPMYLPDTIKVENKKTGNVVDFNIDNEGTHQFNKHHNITALLALYVGEFNGNKHKLFVWVG